VWHNPEGYIVKISHIANNKVFISGLYDDLNYSFYSFLYITMHRIYDTHAPDYSHLDLLDGKLRPLHEYNDSEVLPKKIIIIPDVFYYIKVTNNVINPHTFYSVQAEYEQDEWGNYSIFKIAVIIIPSLRFLTLQILDGKKDNIIQFLKSEYNCQKENELITTLFDNCKKYNDKLPNKVDGF